jgi:MFS family permease
VTAIAEPASETRGARALVISALGIAQILAWGASYYLPAVLAAPIVADTGWSLGWVTGGLSLGLLVSGAVSPAVGRAIERRGGRPVLIASAVLLAAGLVGLALATHIALYLVAWTIVGLGMGAGLYDAAFATLGRRYGAAARGPITALTLWGGFASTACWPLSALLVESWGWRATCLAYAAIHLVIVLPLYVFAVPREVERAPGGAAGPKRAQAAPGAPAAAPGASAGAPTIPHRTAIFALMAAGLTVGAVVATVVSVHLLTLLQARDVALGTAVAFGALLGPAQVGARVIEAGVSRHYHPIWTMHASAVLAALGLAILFAGLPLVAVGIVLYGAGVGLRSIARGTLPLAVFGEAGYAVLMGRLAMPSLIAQALSPTLGALLLDGAGASATFAVLAAAALVNVALVVALHVWCRERAPGARATESSAR